MLDQTFRIPLCIIVITWLLCIGLARPSSNSIVLCAAHLDVESATERRDSRVVPSPSYLEVLYRYSLLICPLGLILAGLTALRVLEGYHVLTSSANDHGGGCFGTFDLLPNEEFLKRRSRDTLQTKVWQQIQQCLSHIYHDDTALMRVLLSYCKNLVAANRRQAYDGRTFHVR